MITAIPRSQINQSQQTNGQSSSNAGFFRRVASIIYDSVVLLALLLVATAIILPFNHGQAFTANNHFYQAYITGIIALFYLYFWRRSGQTIGMLAWRLRLVGVDGNKVSFKVALLRLILAVLAFLPFGVGFFWLLIDKDKCTLYDRWSRTRVKAQLSSSQSNVSHEGLK